MELPLIILLSNQIYFCAIQLIKQKIPRLFNFTADSVYSIVQLSFIKFLSGPEFDNNISMSRLHMIMQFLAVCVQMHNIIMKYHWYLYDMCIVRTHTTKITNSSCFFACFYTHTEKIATTAHLKESLDTRKICKVVCIRGIRLHLQLYWFSNLG